MLTTILSLLENHETVAMFDNSQDALVLTNFLSLLFVDEDELIARYSQTTRGKTQLLYLGQPFVFEKDVKGQSNKVEKKIWRCNQWWNEKCRARVYTVSDRITPLNKFHTHSHVINRKPRVSKARKTIEMIVKIE
jgi:FLYWCH zinc finger domain